VAASTSRVSASRIRVRAHLLGRIEVSGNSVQAAGIALEVGNAASQVLVSIGSRRSEGAGAGCNTARWDTSWCARRMTAARAAGSRKRKMALISSDFAARKLGDEGHVQVSSCRRPSNWFSRISDSASPQFLRGEPVAQRFDAHVPRHRAQAL